MIFKYAYWYFPRAIPKSMCEFIINEGLNSPKQKGMVGSYEGENKDTNLRDSDIVSQSRSEGVFTIYGKLWLFCSTQLKIPTCVFIS